MRLLLIRTVLAVVGIGVVWIVAGRRLTLFADRIRTVRLATLPVAPMTFRDDGIDIGDRILRPDARNGEPRSFSFAIDANGRVTLTSGARTFPLGTRVPGADTGVLAQHALAPDAGDVVAFTLERSAISWPTPLEMNFMTGHAPSWKRNLYQRLVWTKSSGARLEMLWRYEQWYYSSLGWSGFGGMTNEGTTGLARLEITP